MKRAKVKLFLLEDTKDRWDILEEAFKLPVAEREAYILKRMSPSKTTFLGVTDKSGPELAIELIKKGINAKSIGNTKPTK